MAIQSISGAADLEVARSSISTQTLQPTVTKSNLPESPVQKDADKVSSESVKHAVDTVNTFVGAHAAQLRFTVDESTGIRVVKLLDSETDTVIRQIPAEEILSIAKALDKLQGLLIRDKV